MTHQETLDRLFTIHRALLGLIHNEDRLPPHRHTIVDALDDIEMTLHDAAPTPWPEGPHSD